MTYRIVITRNGDYVAGEANRLDNLVKSFKIDDEEEFLECVGEIQNLSDYSLQEIFYASEHEKETFDLTRYLRKQGE